MYNEYLNNLSIPMAVCNKAGKILYYNAPAACFLPAFEKNDQITKFVNFKECEMYPDHSFEELSELLKTASETHRLVNLKHTDSIIQWLEVKFNFFTEESEERILIEITDASDKKRTQRTHEYKETLLSNVLRNSKEAVIAFDDTGNIEFFSPAAERIFGYSATEALIEEITVLFCEDQQDQATEMFKKMTKETGHSHEIHDFNCIDRSGRVFPASVIWSKSNNDAFPLFFINVTDITLLKTFMNSINDAYIRTDNHGIIQGSNEKTEALFGYNEHQLVGKNIGILKLSANSISDLDSNDATIISSPNIFLTRHSKNIDGKDTEEFFATNQKGETLTIQVTVWPQESENGKLHNIILRDITQKKLDETKLKQYAYTDSLTGLANRNSFMNALNGKITSGSNSDKITYLMQIDLDKFKIVNDTLGHDYGDELLINVAHRLNACVRDNDLVSRIGGDEFVILINSALSDNQVDYICDRVLKSFRKSFDVKGKIISITASIGVASCPKHATSAHDLIKAADIAMYHAKQSGKNQFKHFSEDLRLSQLRRLQIESQLKNALANDEFHMVYQPKLFAPEMRIYSVEALIRWNTIESLGEVGPSEFIPIAEESGLITDISKWVFKESIRQFKEWREESIVARKYLTSISVNVSAVHFNSNLVNDLASVLTEVNIPPDCLEIEITESTIMKDLKASTKILKSIREMGIKISVDDFGTGYSSLQYLQQLPLDTIKIDQAFAKGVSIEGHNRFIIEAIISIANKLHLNTIAEGVETKEDIDTLVSLGCVGYQGFYYSQPLSAEDVLPYMIENISDTKCPTLNRRN